jgi:bifunctional UDP-N-acetylglucosamine pyrophosphorylase/glucosamine-1-phosphate N-acetyltransferase
MRDVRDGDVLQMPGEALMSLGALILAAGEGTRMRSQIPKVVHPILGRPMIGYALTTVRSLSPERLAVVIGHKGDQVEALLGGAQTVVQEQQLGTAHAVLEAESAFAGFDGTLLVMPGDAPLITAGTLRRLLDTHEAAGAAATVLTAVVPDPDGYGRVIRDSDSTVASIVEDRDATPEQKAIREVNACVWAFDARALFAGLGRIGRDNAQGEFYLNDIIGVLRSQSLLVAAECAQDWREILGVNSREQLALVGSIMGERINRGWMERGVTIVAPEQTFIGPDASVGADTTVWPGSIIVGATTVGCRCAIGPNTRITDSVLADDTTVEYSVVVDSKIAAGVRVGPYASLRAGTVMADGTKAGTFVEIKNTTVGEGSKVPHLSYIGDATIGRDVNIGAGSITCNYDGFAKSETVVEDGVFVGSDTMLIAPVTIGHDAVIGAGSAISKDVPPESLAVERAEQRTIEGWAGKRRANRRRRS